MIPTFVIALREGVEASLIVGIIAAFDTLAEKLSQVPAQIVG